MALPDNFPLTSLVQQWLDSRGWEDEISVREESRESTLQTRINDETGVYDLYIEVDEERSWLQLYLYSPFKVSARHWGEISKALNLANVSHVNGRGACAPGKAIQYCNSIDLEGCQATTKIIDNLYSYAFGFYARNHEKFGKIIYAGLTAEQAFAEDEKDGSGDIPDEV
jgi:hypothetical protein